MPNIDTTISTTPFSLFISDLHLCDARPDLNRAFRSFCQEQASHAENLYILGDLSDAWIGDDDDGETAQLIRETLKSVADAGVSVFLMVGNRDFLMGQQLARDCNLTILDDPGVIDLYGEQVLLMHGDSLCIDDKEYMAFRAQIQNKQAQQMLLMQPLEKRREIAANLRAQSQSANSNKADDIMDVNADEVMRVLNQHNVKTLIHGHTHRPDIHDLDSSNKKRYVLGDWGASGWYIKADKESIELISFSITE